MGYTKPDPYYNPDKFSFTPIGEVDWYGGQGCYEFSITAVWKNEDGGFSWASDSGCSCNSPFEYFDQNDIESGTAFDAIKALQDGMGENPTTEVQADVADCIQAILNAR